MAITDLINIPANLNPGLSSARQVTMLSLLGNPRGSYDQDCRPVTHANLAALMVTDRVGNFRVTGLLPAVRSLREVMTEIERDDNEVFQALGTAGMHCARFVRGSTTSISNHSWGTAIDLNLNGRLDARGNNRVQVGLARIAPIFNRHGWYWGAGFPTEDGMHFEVSDQKIREWHTAGVFGANPRPQPAPVLSLGDRGRDVKTMQERLKAFGADIIADGIFGRGTLAAVMAFQAAHGLVVDGIVGAQTRRVLGF